MEVLGITFCDKSASKSTNRITAFTTNQKCRFASHSRIGIFWVFPPIMHVIG